MSTCLATVDVGATTQRVINAALRMYNDVILQAALDYECTVIDLRHVCTEPADYTQQIEPTVQGGKSIAEAIYQAYHGTTDRSWEIAWAVCSFSGNTPLVHQAMWEAVALFRVERGYVKAAYHEVLYLRGISLHGRLATSTVR